MSTQKRRQQPQELCSASLAARKLGEQQLGQQSGEPPLATPANQTLTIPPDANPPCVQLELDVLLPPPTTTSEGLSRSVSPTMDPSPAMANLQPVWTSLKTLQARQNQTRLAVARGLLLSRRQRRLLNIQDRQIAQVGNNSNLTSTGLARVKQDVQSHQVQNQLDHKQIQIDLQNGDQAVTQKVRSEMQVKFNQVERGRSQEANEIKEQSSQQTIKNETLESEVRQWKNLSIMISILVVILIVIQFWRIQTDQNAAKANLENYQQWSLIEMHASLNSLNKNLTVKQQMLETNQFILNRKIQLEEARSKKLEAKILNQKEASPSSPINVRGEVVDVHIPPWSPSR